MQLLVRVVDKTSKDPVKDIQLTKRGDVIAVKKDAESWGVEELLNPEWRILHVPDMSELEAVSLLAPETPPLGKPNQPVMKRAFRLNADTLKSLGVSLDEPRPIGDLATAVQTLAEVDTAPKSGLKADPALTLRDVVSVRDTVVQAREAKPALTNPSVIGVEDTVIGPQ
jgi:hypothetical protein